MNGIGFDLLRSGDNRLGIQIAFRCGGPTDMHRHIGLLHMLRMTVCVREHGNRLDTQALTGPDHPTGDLAPVGYQQAFNCTHFCLQRGVSLLKKQ